MIHRVVRELHQAAVLQCSFLKLNYTGITLKIKCYGQYSHGRKFNCNTHVCTYTVLHTGTTGQHGGLSSLAPQTEYDWGERIDNRGEMGD